jgi:hypothetical protein
MLGNQKAYWGSFFTFPDQDKPSSACALERLAILFFGPVAGGGRLLLEFHDGRNVGDGCGADVHETSLGSGLGVVPARS